MPDSAIRHQALYPGGPVEERHGRHGRHGRKSGAARSLAEAQRTGLPGAL